ncbi:MAG: zinc-dependent metalloprotease [Cyclobacteriaceae bacterium]|nr:zinc-dependent metalloprotease [Cyclobacteriaceae bacterium]
MKYKLFTMLLVVFLISNDAVLFAQKKKKNKEETTEKKEEKKEEKVEDKVKKSKKIDGLFTIYQDTINGSVMLFLKKDQIGKEFIYQSFSMGGPPQLFLNQNMLRETWVFSLRKTFDKIEFVKENTQYYYDPENALSKAANADVSEAVFYSVKVEAKNEEGYLIAADDLFLSQKLDQVTPTLPPGIPPHLILNLGSLKKDKSKYLKLRSYPDNTDFVVDLSFENSSPLNSGGAIVTDARYVNVKMQHSFIAMPENNYQPRYDDPRVGYFTQEVSNMTSYSSTPYKDVINRWDLVKKDPDAELSEPVEPVVWWVENTTPVEWRETILEAGRKWNEAFEKAGFKNAVVMKMMPDDADWDPADIRYNVIRWVSSNLGYAIGPSFVNPRTGQILGADITIDFGIMSGANQESDIFEQLTNPFSSKNSMHQCSIGELMKVQFNMAHTVLEAVAPAVDLEQMRHQFMTELILHEMGHTFGLNHNMKASQMLSLEELSNQEITRKKGVMGSVMDYSYPNLIIQDKPVDYYSTKVGPYDSWAIEFGYRSFKKGEEKEGLNKILSRSHEPDLIFGNDADIVYPGSGIDPRVRTWDMSNDVMTYSKNQYELMNTTMGKLKDKFIKEGQSYNNLRQKYNYLWVNRYMLTIGVASYIGGVYVDRSFPEQNSDSKPLTPLPADKQREAMRLLSKYVFAPDAFKNEDAIYPYLQTQRRGFNFFGSPEDPKIQSYPARTQSLAFAFILNPSTLERINNTSIYGNNYSITEVFSDLVSAIFDADSKGSVNLYRQNAQTELVNQFVGILNAKTGYDNASKAAAYTSLKDIQKKINTSVGNAQTKSHRAYLSFLIDRGFETK